MKVGLNFIKEFFKVNVTAEELAEKLTMSGLAVESLKKEKNDWIFDIEVTSNRYDWLSVMGIAGEAAAALGKNVAINYPKVVSLSKYKDKKISIEDIKDCSVYTGRYMQNVRVGRSPGWLCERIRGCGVKEINTVVDIANYCMLKWGNPLHVFDADKIKGNIHIRRAKSGERFFGLDEKERRLATDNLVIADDEKIIALAGVMGAENTKVDDKTKNIFIEGAVFDPVCIRRSRRAVGIDTDSSYRFERKVNPAYLQFAVQQTVNLLVQLCGAKDMGACQTGRKKSIQHKKIILEFNKVREYLGAQLTDNIIKNILAGLGCDVKKHSVGKINVLVPQHRLDLLREVDLYEEIARFYGYDNIPTDIPVISNTVNREGLYHFKNKLRSLMITLGFSEIISYSFEDQKLLEELGYSRFVQISNPLRSQENVMRPTLVTGMSKVFAYNFNRGIKNCKFFEIADLYFRAKTITEKPFLAVGIAGGREEFLLLKGVFNNIVKYFNLDKIIFENKPINNFTNALVLKINGKELGFIGKLDSSAAKILGISSDFFFMQINVGLLMDIEKTKKYSKFTQFPAVSRDISVIMKNNTQFSIVENIIMQSGAEYISGIEIMEFYKGDKIEDDALACTVRVHYCAKDRTLRSDEVDHMHNAIRDKLLQCSDLQLR